MTDAAKTRALRRAFDNGLSKDELVHGITHLAFYAGWPSAMSAITALKKITEGEPGRPPSSPRVSAPPRERRTDS
jgi:4-carboxymuconolactone decarboxylase